MEPKSAVVRSFELCNELHTLLVNSQASIHFRGHLAEPRPLKSTDHFFTLRAEDTAKLEKLVSVAKGEAEESEFAGIHIMDSPSKSSTWRDFIPSTCGLCGEFLHYETNGKEIRTSTTCSLTNGIEPIEFELNVPSGEMVVENDLRDGFRVFDDYDVNAYLGIIKTTLGYADVGLAHSFVGNTCPGVYKVTDENFVIGVKGYTYSDTYEIETESEIPGVVERVAGICTDLWWYSICDKDEYVRRYGAEPDKNSVVKCTPGVYKFKHVFGLLDRDVHDQPQVYTYIDKVRDPDPLRDFKGEYEKLNYTVEQLAPTLFFRDEKFNYAYAASEIMLTFARASEYHPNGWWSGSSLHRLRIDNPVEKFPVFNEPLFWREGGGRCALSFATRDIDSAQDFLNPVFPYMNESFTELAFNVCQALIRHGIVRSDSRTSDEDFEKETTKAKRLAKMWMTKLSQRYPDRIPEYCKELLTNDEQF